MKKSKTQQKLQHISNLKERFRGLSTETIVSRLANFNKSNEIAIAYKDILRERGIVDYYVVLDKEATNNTPIE